MTEPRKFKKKIWFDIDHIVGIHRHDPTETLHTIVINLDSGHTAEIFYDKTEDADADFDLLEEFSSRRAFVRNMDR